MTRAKEIIHNKKKKSDTIVRHWPDSTEIISDIVVQIPCPYLNLTLAIELK